MKKENYNKVEQWGKVINKIYQLIKEHLMQISLPQNGVNIPLIYECIITSSRKQFHAKLKSLTSKLKLEVLKRTQAQPLNDIKLLIYTQKYSEKLSCYFSMQYI